jgi:hypothetical protein
MPPITILKSELVALEKRIKAQEQIILNQHEMIKVMKNALVVMGGLPAEPAPITPARPVGPQ